MIHYIKTNCTTRNACLNCIMGFYNLLKYRPDMQNINLDEVFNAFADRTVEQNQMILSDIYLYIEDGKIQEAINFFKQHV